MQRSVLIASCLWCIGVGGLARTSAAAAEPVKNDASECVQVWAESMYSTYVIRAVNICGWPVNLRQIGTRECNEYVALGCGSLFSGSYAPMPPGVVQTFGYVVPKFGRPYGPAATYEESFANMFFKPFAIADRFDHRDDSHSALSGGGNQQTPYSGPHADVAVFLLQHATGWTVSSTEADNHPPTMSAVNCQRDAYVFAAQQYAWAAEAETATGHPDRAAQAIDGMMKSLRDAHSLCSNAPSVQNMGQGCLTDWLTCAYLASVL